MVDVVLTRLGVEDEGDGTGVRVDLGEAFEPVAEAVGVDVGVHVGEVAPLVAALEAVDAEGLQSLLGGELLRRAMVVFAV